MHVIETLFNGEVYEIRACTGKNLLELLASMLLLCKLYHSALHLIQDLCWGFINGVWGGPWNLWSWRIRLLRIVGIFIGTTASFYAVIRIWASSTYITIHRAIISSNAFLLAHLRCWFRLKVATCRFRHRIFFESLCFSLALQNALFLSITWGSTCYLLDLACWHLINNPFRSQLISVICHIRCLCACDMLIMVLNVAFL